jgi:defect-in-organelle-trafficking protein DotC
VLKFGYQWVLCVMVMGVVPVAAQATSFSGASASMPINDAFSPEIHPAGAAPLSVKDLQNIPGGAPLKQDMGPPIDIRKDALREAALSLGARGGLAFRTFQIREDLKKYEGYLDKVFDFRQLLIPAPSGLMIEPPIVSETDDALIIEPAGLKAAVADRILNINQNARIVTAPRTWRTYLERSWGAVELPPDILRPKTDEERAEWRKYVDTGWAQGIAQANETFENDLHRLSADFGGMVRYRKLLAQGMISSPFALQTDRGITGGGKDNQGRAQALRIGDRAIQMTGVPELVPVGKQWQPANQ